VCVIDAGHPRRKRRRRRRRNQKKSKKTKRKTKKKTFGRTTGVHLSRAKLITRFDDRYAEPCRNKSGV